MCGRSMQDFFPCLLCMHEFSSLNFPLHESFFCTSPAPPPHNFSNGPSLTALFKQVEASDPRWSEMGVFPPTWLIRDR